MSAKSKLKYVTSQISDMLVGEFSSQSPTSMRKNMNQTPYKDFNYEVVKHSKYFP